MPKSVGSKKIWVIKSLVKKNVLQKIKVKKDLSPKTFWVQKKLGPNKIEGEKRFCSEKCWPRKFCVCILFLVKQF